MSAAAAIATPERASEPGPFVVLIYQLAERFEWVTWLCAGCLKTEWLDKGWQVRGRKTPPHPLRCDECKRTSETTGGSDAEDA